MAQTPYPTPYRTLRPPLHSPPQHPARAARGCLCPFPLGVPFCGPPTPPFLAFSYTTQSPQDVLGAFFCLREEKPAHPLLILIALHVRITGLSPALMHDLVNEHHFTMVALLIHMATRRRPSPRVRWGVNATHAHTDSRPCRNI